MTLKPEDRALIKRVMPRDYDEALAQDIFTTDEVVALIQAARSEGDVSRGGAEPVAWVFEYLGHCGDGEDPTWETGVQLVEPRNGRGFHYRNIRPLYATPPPALPDEVVRLVKAATEIIDACEEDCGVPDAGDEDDEAVGASSEREMALTFGIMRRVRAALAPFADRLLEEVAKP